MMSVTAPITALFGSSLNKLFSWFKPQTNANAPEESKKLKPLDIEFEDGDWGIAFSDLVYPYIVGSTEISIYEPFAQMPWQLENLRTFLETALDENSLRRVTLITKPANVKWHDEWIKNLDSLKSSLAEFGVMFVIKTNPLLHDRKIVSNNGWTIRSGRGLHVYHQASHLAIGGADYKYRLWRKTEIQSSYNNEHDKVGYSKSR